MLLVRRPWIWLLRFRKRKGYGVHSPWAFSFITHVINEKTPFYAYKELEHHHPGWMKWVCFYPLRCRRMLFRVANYFHPETIVCLGDSPTEEAYFRSAVPTAAVHHNVDALKDRRGGWLLFVKHSHLDTITPEWLQSLSFQNDKNRCCLILEGIHGNRSNLARWHQLQASPLTGVTFDLYTYGIVCFDFSMHKQHYKVNF